jgi:hypothetical protein
VIQPVRAVWDRPGTMGRTRDSRSGHRRKETAGEFATRPFGCVYHSMPGGLPYRRLTFTLRDPRAPGLLEVRGFCLPATSVTLSGRVTRRRGTNRRETECMTTTARI